MVAEKTFPRNARVLKRVDFERAVQKGKRYRNRYFSIAVYNRDDRQPARIGLSATRKLGNAVIRNRAKRRARDIFRNHREWISDGIDLVVLFYGPSADCEFEKFKSEFLALIDKTGYLRTKD